MYKKLKISYQSNHFKTKVGEPLKSIGVTGLLAILFLHNFHANIIFSIVNSSPFGMVTLKCINRAYCDIYLCILFMLGITTFTLIMRHLPT